ncbi:phasin [Methylobacterium sp. Leaf469]|jgi:phasin|uniref:phasin n=1 Tax=unclassified Methylobacterium TaxID=2615210 RepID=UPI0006FEB836|nr:MULTISPECIES: phasin [unclassified Methylobacterium]USU30800.1 phasin [Methylobacterium sp. OTU13CASTA1]KQO72536.1 phasin [Methylobacterium sp. Leaf87]KQP24503.1 phasin [Methylobacterium sp. Leaf102]KQP60301.1 phasin [Methylobacterium sp. Leaf112]KQT93083.1 phasin [Methylobacterium sp. Leaf469]
MTGQTFEIPTEMRAFAEKSVDQARSAVGNLIGTAIKTSEQLQTQSKTVQESMQTALAKSFDHAQENATATFDFAQKLVRTRDLREAFELQSEFLRSQIASLQNQAKDLGALAQNTLRPSA